MSGVETTSTKDVQAYIDEILEDFKLVCLSREASLLGRKEVLTGKAKFGIFGDGKELAQIAMAKNFKNGDWRSGYYRDQTFMMAIGQLTVKQYFAGLYAHTDIEKEPFSAGRQMNGHFSTHSLNEDGSWKDLCAQKNSSSDISPTAGQMPRLLGLALASKLFKHNEELHSYRHLSNEGNEVAFGTIGDAATSEGPFWETINAAAVLQVPMAMSVWDDGYGISVSRKDQTAKDDISKALAGLQRTDEEPGYEMFKVKGWDYPALIRTYQKAIDVCRSEQVPVLVHVTEVTQPQGHSTSGSHERYKSQERLNWEGEYDCVQQFKTWISEYDNYGTRIATIDELNEIQSQAKKEVRAAQKEAWKEFSQVLTDERAEALALITAMSQSHRGIESTIETLTKTIDPIRKDFISAVRRVLQTTAGNDSPERQALQSWYANQVELNTNRYSSHLWSETDNSALRIDEVPAEYDEENEVDGRLVLRDNFKVQFENNPLIVTFGEDTGKIGGVNQSMENMQEWFGTHRVMDAGIREATIAGQGIGLALRGMRPIAEIQYLDYLLYCLQVMSDDLATVRYRTMGTQKAPLIVRTRGHRLEGVWHSGSPMGAIINAVRGIYVCVPRNMTKAAGFYNTLLKSDDPALVIEPLNGYRTKELMPTNLGEFCEPLGKVEKTREGDDLTIISYGSTFNLCTVAAERLAESGIEVDLIDAQTLLPFDINKDTVKSVEKTGRLMIVDEDVPGGGTAFILERLMTGQDIYFHLDSAPVTLSAKAHRPAYSSDGDYFSKPSIDDIFEAAYDIMSESDPSTYPAIH